MEILNAPMDGSKVSKKIQLLRNQIGHCTPVTNTPNTHETSAVLYIPCMLCVSETIHGRNTSRLYSYEFLMW